MSYSDRDMLVLTQLAYYDFNERIVAENEYNATVRELLEQDPGVLQRLEANRTAANTEAEIYRAEQALELYDEIVNGNSEYGDWVIKAIKDDNVNTGFYGCLIETPSGDGLIGFRGSESYDTTQVVNDWVLADFALLTGTDTSQQNRAESFMQEIYENYDYDNYYLSGHSLGGNLSFHAAITAPEGMRDSIQSYSYDGPGFSSEYLVRYADEIKESKGRLTHYQWSLVGGLLNQPWGTKNQIVGIEGESIVGLISFQRHDTCFVEFDENGNVVNGNPDLLTFYTSDLSRLFDARVNYINVICVAVFNALEEAQGRVEDSFEQLQNIFVGVKEKIASFFDNKADNNSHYSMKADFRVDIPHLQSTMNKLEGYMNDLKRIADETDSIASNLGESMQGMFFWILKRKISMSAHDALETRNKMKRVKNVGMQLSRQYMQTESSVVRQY